MTEANDFSNLTSESKTDRCYSYLWWFTITVSQSIHQAFDLASGLAAYQSGSARLHRHGQVVARHIFTAMGPSPAEGGGGGGGGAQRNWHSDTLSIGLRHSSSINKGARERGLESMYLSASVSADLYQPNIISHWTVECWGVPQGRTIPPSVDAFGAMWPSQCRTRPGGPIVKFSWVYPMSYREPDCAVPVLGAVLLSHGKHWPIVFRVFRVFCCCFLFCFLVN